MAVFHIDQGTMWIQHKVISTLCAGLYTTVWYDAPISPAPDRHYFTRYCYGCATHITVGLTSITSVPVSFISLGFPVFRVFPVSKSCTSTKHTLIVKAEYICQKSESVNFCVNCGLSVQVLPFLAQLRA